MQRSESIAALSKALVKAQKALKPLVRDSQNPHFRNSYASLTAVVEVVNEALNAQGIALLQFSEPSQLGTMRLETILLHESGEWMSGTMEMPLPKADPQGLGSAHTYCRRYSAMAALGLAPEDDDAEAASPRPQAAPAKAPQAPQKPVPPPDPPVDWEKWKTAFSALLVKLGANAQTACEGAGVPFDPSMALYRLVDDATKRQYYATIKGIAG